MWGFQCIDINYSILVKTKLSSRWSLISIYIYMYIEIVTYIDIVTRVNLQAEVIVSAFHLSILSEVWLLNFLGFKSFQVSAQFAFPRCQHALASVIICADLCAKDKFEQGLDVWVTTPPSFWLSIGNVKCFSGVDWGTGSWQGNKPPGYVFSVDRWLAATAPWLWWFTLSLSQIYKQKHVWMRTYHDLSTKCDLKKGTTSHSLTNHPSIALPTSYPISGTPDLTSCFSASP